MAAFISQLNRCPFCAGIHSGIAELHGGSDAIKSLQGDWRAASFDPRIKATFALLEKMTRTPDGLERGDVDRVRATGVSDAAIDHALHLCFLFNTINRLASALNFSWESESDRLKLAAGLNRMRYHVPGLLLR